MDDKNLMQDILLIEKGICDLYMHGSIESSTDNVHDTFKTALNSSLNIQDTIYDKMSAKGWYNTQSVEQTKIDSVKQKFNTVQ